MAVYGGIQARELEYWLNTLINAAYDQRYPLAKVHGNLPRARMARQDLLDMANSYRSNRKDSDATAMALGRWCQVFLTEEEWYQLTGARLSGNDTPADWLVRHHTG